MPHVYTINLIAWGTIDAQLASNLKVAIANKLDPNYRTGARDTVLLNNTTYSFTVGAIDQASKRVTVTVADPRRA